MAKTKKTRRKTSEQQPLTLMQQLFVDAYLGEAQGNATLACRMAGYKGSDNVLGKMGHYNLTNGKISQAIQRRKAEITRNTGMDLEWWVRECERGYKKCVENEDEQTARQYLEMAGRHVGVFERDNLQRSDKIGIIMR